MSRDNEARRADSLPTEQRDEPTDGTAEGTTHEDTTDELRMKYAAIVRKMDNECPQAFAAFVGYVRERAEINERETFGSEALRRFIGSKEFTTKAGTAYHLRHGEDAAIMRELCRRHPDIAPRIRPRLRRSKFDAVFRDEA